jgi:hypothetical protein
VVVDAEAGAGVALRVEVDDQDVGAVQRQRRRQVDGARGLADAALLVGHGDDPVRGRAREVEAPAGVERADGGGGDLADGGVGAVGGHLGRLVVQAARARAMGAR